MHLPVKTVIFIFLAAKSTLASEVSANKVPDLEVISVEQDHSNGFGYEIIQTKLDMLEFRFSELFVQLKEQGEAFLNNQRRVEDEQRQLNRMVDRHERKISNLIVDLEDSVGFNISRIGDQSRQILELQTICSNHDSIRSQLLELHPKNASAGSKKMASHEATHSETCTQNSGQMSGLCRMQIGSEDTLVYREQVRFGGNWVVILQRYDGSELFNRSWAEYRDGFGVIGREFWIGLERLHLLTNSSAQELVVELEDFKGNYRYAKYDDFSVGSEKENYPLSVLGEYAGTAGDALRNHVGVIFKTDDGCSKKFGNGGGWYYEGGDCFKANVMGKWQNIKDWTSIIWATFSTVPDTPLKFIRMMVRESSNK